MATNYTPTPEELKPRASLFWPDELRAKEEAISIIYNPYGTLLSDVWRDIQIHTPSDIGEIENRLQDVFGLSPYEILEVVDMRKCHELKPADDFGSLEDKTLSLFPKRRGLPQDSRLINGDCLTSLAAIPTNSIDFCFADPPYNIEKKYDHWNDALEAKDYFAWCDKWLSELARIVKPGGTVAVINIPLWAVRHYQHLSTMLRFQSWIAWDGLSLPVRMIMPSHYAIVCFSKGRASLLAWALNRIFFRLTPAKTPCRWKSFFASVPVASIHEIN